MVDDPYASWRSLPSWLTTHDVVTPRQRASLPPVKVWRLALRASGMPFVPRSVGLWISEFLSGSYHLRDVHDLADTDELRYRQHFTTWRSVATIAETCGASDRTVRDALAVLEDAGWLHVGRVDPDTGSEWRALNQANRLTIVVPASASQPSAHACPASGCDFVAMSAQGLGSHARHRHPRCRTPGEPSVSDTQGGDQERTDREPPPVSDAGAPSVSETTTLGVGDHRPSVSDTDELTTATHVRNSLQDNSPSVDAATRGTSLAAHVRAQRLTVDDAKRAGDLYGLADREDFLEALNAGLAS